MKYFPASLYKYFLLLSLTGLPAITMIAQVPLQAAKAAPLITRAIDDTSLITLLGNVHPLATSAADQGAALDSLQLGRTILVLKSSPARRVALDKFTDDQQNPKSPNYHKWLTPAQYGEQFGVAAEDIQKINDWLTGHGFQLEEAVAGRNLVIFSGTHAQLKSAFHTTLHTYNLWGKSYFANANDPQIPTALADIVVGFTSLNNFPRSPLHTKPQLVKRDSGAWVKASPRSQPEFTTTDAGTLYHLLAPYDLAAIYNITSLWNAGIDGTGQTIAIVSDSNINPADIDYFRATFGLPAKKLNIIVYGSDPGMNENENEADLDVQWSGAVAKNATIDLVVSADGTATNGVDGAAVYIINNNLATILNVSYGLCEASMGTAGNQHYNTLWEQAAAQGITVLVATGDSGSATCDPNSQYAHGGLAVSGFASTPYNVAVGGTDFHSTFDNPTAYWNANNDPTTLASSKGYLPESAWNNSCGNPDVLAALQANGDTTDTTAESLCNDVNFNSFLTTEGGSGGVSNCAVTGSNASVPCISGYPKPSWQSGVPGIPNDGARDLPDISLMAGNGLWGSFYVYCQSDITPNGVCDVNNALEGAGGTSFAAPIFSGMMALLQQKTASKQGNVNYVLYKLATAQYTGSNATACNSATVAAGNPCMFYDVTESGNAVDCVNGFPNCTPTVSSDLFGVLPGYSTTTGYDLVTGLGTINAYNLVQGWSTATATFLPSTITISSAGITTATYGATSTIAVNVVVAPVAPATGVPSGDVGITSNSNTISNDSVTELTLTAAKGRTTAVGLPVGTYELFAHYAGDATFSPSTSSAGVSVTVSKAATNASLSATRTSVLLGQNVSFSVEVTGVINGLNPTGTVTFTNTTTGALLSSQTITASASSATGTISTALVTVPASQLQSGANTITANYEGDSNYLGIAPSPVVVILASAITTRLSASTLTIAPNQAGSVIVTVTPAASVVLTPSTLVFSCPVQLPDGLRCSFSTPIAGDGGVIFSTLTIQTSAPLIVRSGSGSASVTHHGWMAVAVTGSLAGLMMLFRPRRRKLPFLFLILTLVSLSSNVGCSGKAPVSGPALINTTTTLSLSSAAPTLGSPVTLTAQVSPSAGPSGSVMFSSASAALGTSPVASGVASLTTSSLAIGSQTLSATYSGDSAYLGSASAASTLDVAFSSGILVTAADSAGDTSSAGLTLVVR
ncbi:Ig-like domain repeat protein [Terriglobus saanensis]|uniref:Peptidase S53 propeptide n=1 Tax=Terriglobus saanensis (strain ATCC BAA-1853 / DSM 23119 / SP1PR4) TaxID=401053 RepID=E8UXV9_TERSS|nr:Ig-like domain repeat protein [Terriglobus saanensis]ADV83125.1 Peptidase S53 propeptide [Terriglobus saanensis SP1PR4]